MSPMHEPTPPEEHEAALRLYMGIARTATPLLGQDGASIADAFTEAVRAALKEGRYIATTPKVRALVRWALTIPTAHTHGGDKALERIRGHLQRLFPRMPEAEREETARGAIGLPLIPPARYDALLAEHGIL